MSQEAVKNLLLTENYGFTQGEGDTLVSKEGIPVAWDGNAYQVVQKKPEEKETVAADTTNTVSGQTDQALGSADTTNTVSGQTDQALGSADTTVNTGIVETQNPVNVGLIDNLEGVTVPNYASSQGATHYNSVTGEYGTLTAGQTKTVGTNTYIDQVVKDADGNTVFEDKVVEGEPKQVITIKAGAEPEPELFTFDVNDIQDRGDGGGFFRPDLRSYIDITDGKGGTTRLETNNEIAATDDLVTAGLLDHEYFKREGITSIDQLTGSRGTGGEVTKVFASALEHINKLNVEQQKKIDAWKKDNEIKTLQSTTKIVKVPKIEKIEQTKTVNEPIFNPIGELKKEEKVITDSVETCAAKGMNYDPTTKTCIAKPVDPVNLMDSNALANQSPDVIVGDATGVTKAEIDRNNQAVLNQMAIGSPVTSVSVPKPTYSTYTPTTQTFQTEDNNQTGAATSTYGMANVSGTQQVPLQTAGLSAVPQTVQVKPQYTGTTLQNLSSISQQGFGGQVVYISKFGQQITVSVDATGKPLTYVPPGFKRGIPDGQGGYRYPGDTVNTQAQYQGGMTSYALGGDVQGQLRLANKFLGYQGEATQDSLNAFLNSNPGAAAKMGKYQQAMSNMAQPIQQMYQGGPVRGFDAGGAAVDGQTDPAGHTFHLDGTEHIPESTAQPIVDNRPDTFTGGKFSYADTVVPMFAGAVQQTMQPVQGAVNYITPQPADFIGSTAGQTAPIAPMAEAATIGNVTQSQMAQTKGAGTYGTTGVAPSVATAVEGGRTLRPQELLTAATQGKVYIGGEGPRWDEAKGKYVQGGVETAYQEFTPEEFAAQNNLNIGDFQTTYGQLQPAQGTVTKGPLSAQQTKFDEDGRPISAVSDSTAATGQMIAKDPKTGLYDTSGIEGKEIFKEPTNEYKRELIKDPITGDFTELISSSVNPKKAALFTEAIQESTASPTTKATVAGQLAILMADFEGGDTPAWAAGSMRAANAAMIQRGLGASSMAGQAIIQAAMESALPIAMADAQTEASFEAQNLSNKQAKRMLEAQQRAAFMGQKFDQQFQARVQNAAKISDIANQNFSADQTIQLENSRAAQTLSLTNLSNNQAMVMAEAAALAGLDTQNLNNRQQAAVQNAQNFLQMDMANLTNKQQTAMFKTQQNVQALFTDQAAENASKQFNASSTNQTNQFFANLATQTAQFNAAQTNAMDQFNVNAVNGLREFNSNIQQQRDMFNAQNGLVIAQANAQWRQNIATLNNATQNESNMDFAKTINGLTSKNLDEIWQRERDLMSFNFTSVENSKEHAVNILLGEKELEELRETIAYNEDKASTKMLFDFFFDPFGQLKRN